MNDFRTPSGEWGKLDGLRGGLLSRLERLAQLTLPATLAPDNYNNDSQQLTNGYSSLGSQAVTHLVNKLMLTMFAPSRPFMRLDIEREEKAKLMAQLGIEEDDVTDALAIGEKQAMDILEQAGQRQELFTLVTHLAVIGNVLLDLSGEDLNVIGIRDYCVKRTAKGKIAQLIIRENCTFEELEERAKGEYLARFPSTRPDEVVPMYTWVRLQGGMYHSEVWIKDVQLSDAFKGRYKPENLPWRPLTWTLPVKQNYGVGRAEEYANDLAEHEALSEALSNGAALATSFKWLANPAGITRPEDVTMSANGAVIPGAKEDMSLLYANIGQQLATVQGIKSEVARRIGQGFLMNSAVTRDAERVTAEEIRIQALELESSLGGAYSRLALDIQQPLAHWLLKRAGVKIQGTKIMPKVVTGLDALSRSADRERMMLFLQDVTTLDSIQPETRAKLRETNIISDMAAGAGVERGRYVASKEEIAQLEEAQKAKELNETAQQEAVQAAAQKVTNEATQ